MTVAYCCTTTVCSERFRGFTDEPTFCSICTEDLTAIPTQGRSLDELNAMVLVAPRPMPENPERPPRGGTTIYVNTNNILGGKA